MFLRLRQICLVARELEPMVERLCAIFDVQVCYRDPVVAQFGLHNALMPFETTFLEVVAPVEEGTAAGRYLDKRGGDGGYMVILDCGDLPHRRKHLQCMNVRLATELTVGRYEGIQLHPRDTGGTLLEFNATEGGEDLHGPYGPGGPQWQSFVRTDVTRSITAAVIQAADPAALARRWSDILQRPETRDGQAFVISLDNAVLRFVPMADERGEGLIAMAVSVADPQAVIERARALDCVLADGCVTVGGIDFHLHVTPKGQTR